MDRCDGSFQSGSVRAAQEQAFDRAMSMRRLTAPSFNSPFADNVSDTSSTRERKIALALGGPDDFSDDGAPYSSPHTLERPRNVGQRLYNEGTTRERARHERLKLERDRVTLNEMAELTQRPNITTRARTKPSKGGHFSEHAAMWQAQRDSQLQHTARAIEAEREAEFKSTPTIAPKSRIIAADRAGPVEGWDEHFARFAAKRAAATAATKQGGTFQPNINANAVRVDVEKSIEDRLYTDARERRRRLEERVHTQRRNEGVDPETGKPYFTPRRHDTDPKSRISREDALAVSDRLYASASRTRSASTEHRDAAWNDPNLSFSPAINEHSEEIIANRQRRPLYTPRAEREARREADEARRREEQNQSVANRKADPSQITDFLRRAQQHEVARGQRLSALRNEMRAQEQDACTFSPSVAPKSEQIFAESNVSFTPRSPVPSSMPTSRVDTPRNKTRQAPVSRSLPLSEPPLDASPVTPQSVMPSMSPLHTGGPALEGVDTYIEQFESQMHQVLEEWRQLETV